MHFSKPLPETLVVIAVITPGILALRMHSIHGRIITHTAVSMEYGLAVSLSQKSASEIIPQNQNVNRNSNNIKQTKSNTIFQAAKQH